MKSFFKGLVTTMLLVCFGVGMTAQNTVGERAYRIFEPFYGATQTGLLADKSIGTVRPQDFSTSRQDSTDKMSSNLFESLYLTMAITPVAQQYLLPGAGPLYADDAGLRYPGGILPLAAMAFRYDYIRPDALALGLVSFGVDSVLVPHVPPSSLLRIDTVFAVGPHRDILYSDTVTFLYPSTAQNLGADFTTFWIDAGDGTGPHILQPGGSYTAVYAESGDKSVVVYPAHPSLSYLRSHFDIEIRHNFAQSSPPPITSYDQHNPIHSLITAELAYLGEKAQADLYHFPSCADGKIRKPLLIIDGFDPQHEGNSNQYEHMFLEERLGIQTLIGSTDGAPIEIHQALFNEGYDLFFLDYKDIEAFDHTKDIYYFVPLLDEYENPVFDPETHTPLGDWVYDKTVTINKLIRRGGQDYIQRNAYMVQTAIKYINDQLVENNATHNKLNIVALSMGGLVTRWAILDLEERGIDHNIEHFYSWDSPQNGAHIPPGLQAMIHDFYTMTVYVTPFWEVKIRDFAPVIGQKYSVLTSPAASQMLIYRQAGGTGWNNFNTLNDEIKIKGKDGDGDIKNCSWKAIANGSLTGGNIDMNNEAVPFNPGDIIATFNITGGNTIVKTDKNIWDELVDIGLGLLTGSQLSVSGAIISLKSSGKSLVYHRTMYVTILGYKAKDDYKIGEVNDSRPIDCSPGGFTTLGQDVDLIKFKVYCNNFTPTYSSLAVRNNVFDFVYPDFANVNATINSNILRVKSYVGPTSPVISFRTRDDGSTQSFRSQINQLHTFNSYNSTAFFAHDLLTTSKFNLSELNNQVLNFGNLSQNLEPDYNPNMFQPKKMNGYLSNSLDVKNKSTLGVNIGGQLGLNPGSNMPNNISNSEFILSIIEGGCEPNNPVVRVDKSSKVQVGDWSILNKGILNIGNNATLEVSGSLDIQPKSEVRVLEGGRLIIRSGATLSMVESQIIVEQGGELIIEDDPKLTFWAGSKIIIRGQADFGKITCANVNGEIHLPTGGKLNLHGDFNFTGISTSQILFNVGANNSVNCDTINLTLKNGKIIGGDYTEDFRFVNGADRVTLTNLTFEGGTGIHVSNTLSSLTAVSCTFSDMETGIRAVLANNTTSRINISKSRFLKCDGLYANNVSIIDISESEFIGRKLTYQFMWQAKRKGIDVNNTSQLNIDRSFFARLQYGIKTTGTNTSLKCSYSINNVYGIEHFNYYDNARTLKLVQSGLINNLVGCLSNNTNLDINISGKNGTDANLFVHCNGTDFDVPERFSKLGESNPFVEGDSEENRDVPFMPSCGAFFRGTVSQFNVINFELEAKNNIWVCNTLSGYCNWSNLKDNNSNYIDLLRDPEVAYNDRKNIEECVTEIISRSSDETTDNSGNRAYSVYPNPAKGIIRLKGAEGVWFRYTILDSNGNVVLKGMGFGESTVDIENLTQGVYVVSITSDTGDDRVMKLFKTN